MRGDGGDVLAVWGPGVFIDVEVRGGERSCLAGGHFHGAQALFENRFANDARLGRHGRRCASGAWRVLNKQKADLFAVRRPA